MSKLLSTSLISVYALACFTLAQSVARATALPNYEQPPKLKASEILRPEFLKGPYHHVREEVSTYSGANRFTIDSEFGVFEAEGNEMLVRRINEINAIARLKEISRSDEYKRALVKATTGPLATTFSIVTDPAEAITNTPKGVMKFMGGIGEKLNAVGKKKQGHDPEGSPLQQIIGFSDTKRKLALRLGVDPYSTNVVLQHELDGIAWASFAGKATFDLGTIPIAGPAGIALTAADAVADFDRMVKDQSPTDLRISNRKALIRMGASKIETDEFLDNNAFSPSAQTAFVLNLKSIDGAANRPAFVRLAGETSSSEADAIFCVQTAALMSQLHKQEKKLARIEVLGDFPFGVTTDGTIVFALQWDYAVWIPAAAHACDEIERFAQRTQRKKRVLVALSGPASPRFRQELEARGHVVKDRISPGPLK